MPFFVFGQKEDSWIIGNDVYILTHNFDRPSDDFGLLGNINYVTVGANDMEAWVKKDGRFYLTQDKNLLADIKGNVDHLAFNPSGGWFISYSEGQARLSMEGKFSEAFHNAAGKFMTTKGPSSYSLQYSTLWRVFFGAEGSYILQFRKGGLQWNGIAQDAAKELNKMHEAGWMLTSRTCLSPLSIQHYYIEWTKNVAPTQFHTPEYRIQRSYQLPTSSMLQPLFVRQIMEGQYPTEIPVEEEPVGLEPANSRLSIESLRDFCAAVFSESKDKNSMTGEEFKSVFEKMLPAEDMAKIWDLTDLDHDGKYSFDEFTLAWYLVIRRFGGKQLPKTIPMAAVLKAKEYDSNIARRTILFGETGPITCTGCQADIMNEEYGSSAFVHWITEGDFNDGIVLLCVVCYFFKCPEGAKDWKFKWTAMVRLKGEWPAETRFCSHCATLLKRGDYECEHDSRHFGLCKSCYKPALRCPDNHRLQTRFLEQTAQRQDAQDGEVSSLFESLNVSSTETDKSSISSNPFTPSPSSNSTNPFSANTTPSSETSNPLQENSKDKSASKQEDNGKPVDPSSLTEQDKQLREALGGQILKESPNVTWDDIAGLEAAKEELQEAVILPIRFPKLFSGKRKPRRGILLYGPPGTGKSYLAKAVATEAGSTLFSISSSDVTSKWLGESEKLVKTLFKMARENKPSVIFIDELDALCGSRDTPGHNPHMQGLKTEFMVQMDGVGNDNEGILLLAATNLPWSLDPAIRRRFQRKLYIPLPDEEARAEMFKIHVGESMAELTEEDYAKLGKQTDGLSGSDISIAVQDALMQPVKKVSSSKHWRKVMDEGVEKLTPCKPTDEGAMPMSWRKVPASKLLEPKVEVEDFFKVLEKIKPTVSEEEIKKCSDWTDQFGTEGA